MRPSPTVRARSGTHAHSLHDRKPASALDRPGAFQCTILRALELRKADRDVFLLKDVQGYGLAEIAAILGISTDTALARLMRARREVGYWGDSGAMERG